MPPEPRSTLRLLVGGAVTATIAAIALANAQWELRQMAASTARSGVRRMKRACRAAVRHVVDAPTRIEAAALRLSGVIAGCGCIDDDAETCHGEWCECSCHTMGKP